MELKRLRVTVALLIFNILEASSRATLDQVKHVDEDQEIQEIQLHVLTKREALNDIQQDYPHVEGRTFRASEPLDPKSSDTVNGDPPQNIFEAFETKNEIFQPEVDTENLEEPSEDTAESNVEQNTGNGKENVTGTEEEKTTTYGAQYPYSETSVSGGDYYSSLPQAGTSSQGYQTDDGLQHSVTSRRVVLAGRGPDTSRTGVSDTGNYGTSRRYTEYQASQTSRTGQTYQTSGTSYDSQYGRPYSGSRQLSTERRFYSGSNGGITGNNRNPNTRTEARGPYYGGPVYVDSNGHYVDAQGRHLDSTGRYYDTSGRYQDAIMTGFQTFRHTVSGTSGTPTYNTRTSSSQYNSPRRYSSGTSPSGGYYDSEGRYISGSSNLDSGVSYGTTNQDGGYVDTSQSRPVDSYGGTQFYSSGRSYQTTYDPVVSQISSDPNCPMTNTRVTINGLTCHNAVAQLGPYVCYNYERVSTECCERCLQVKRPENLGCEYGDRSHQCRDIQPFDCYNERNRQVCCDRCRQFREQRAQTSPAGCEYGDLTNRCQSMVQRPYLCYLPENQRVCCQSCPRLANTQEPSCQWGNQNPELCHPYDANRRLQLNCYLQAVQEICCATCRSLRERMRDVIPGCEYGDSPVLFYSGREALDCPAYISQYGLDNCDDPEISRKCCYTCYRYRSSRG